MNRDVRPPGLATATGDARWTTGSPVSLQAVRAPTQGKQIGLIPCMAFAVGTMIGAGVFVLSGLAVERAGPAALVSFALAAVLVLLSALSFAVVASRARQGETGYAYVGRALSPFWQFLTSWAFYLGGVIGVAFVLGAFGQYLHEFFWSSASPLAAGIAAAAVLTLLNLGPADLIGRAELGLVLAKVTILALLVVFAFLHLDRAHFRPFSPHGNGSILTTSGLLFVAYLGFNVVCSMAPQVKDASRTIPRAIVCSMALVAVVYLGVVVALLAGQISQYNEASVGRAAQHLMGSWGGVLIPIGALVSTLSAANDNILGSSEIMVRLAANRDVPTALGRMWRGQPAVSVLLGAALYTILMLTGSTSSVVSLANVAAIGAMALINIAAAIALHLDRSNKRGPGGLRLPLGWTLPALGLITAVSQLAFIDFVQVALGLVLLTAGAGIYLLRHRLHHPVHHAELAGHVARGNTPAARAIGGRSRSVHLPS